ncbi:MAG: hypothetical protein B5M52_00240 [Helicobacteraceae bacterium 4484_230]|nr:MAG: hypothetical protein B5M52_00240 [Helicobacteraceae bacterium 4484_230]
MSKKISLTVNGSRFDIDLEDDFADYLNTQLKKDFSLDSNNELKKLLQAYVRRSHELFEQEKKISGMIDLLAKTE